MVALFNAISTAKKDLSAASSEDKKNDESNTLARADYFNVCSCCAGDESSRGPVDER